MRRAFIATNLALLLSLAGTAKAQDAALLEAAGTLARGSRVVEQALVSVRGELWRQLRGAERKDRNIQFARYQCISALDPAALTGAFAQAYATQLDAQALQELAVFYSRREIGEMMDRRLAALRQRYSLPDFQPPATGPTRDQIVGRGRMAFGALQDSPAHRAFEKASQAAYAGPARALLADLQDRCGPAAAPPAEPLVRATVARSGQLLYPDLARQYGVQGMLEVVVQVDAGGKPVKASVAARWLNLAGKEASDSRAASITAAIDEAVIRGVMETVFEPLVRDGQPAEATYRLPFNMVLR